MPFLNTAIETWLSELPSSGSLKHENIKNSSSTLKRKSVRLPLADMDAGQLPNKPAPPRTASPKRTHSTSLADESPSKRAMLVHDVESVRSSVNLGEVRQILDAPHDNVSQDPHATPKPSYILRSRAMKHYNAENPSAAASSAASSRPSSPTKMIQQQGPGGGMDLRVLNNIDEIAEEHPLWNIRDLLDRLDACREGVKILSESMKVCVCRGTSKDTDGPFSTYRKPS